MAPDWESKERFLEPRLEDHETAEEKAFILQLEMERIQEVRAHKAKEEQKRKRQALLNAPLRFTQNLFTTDNVFANSAADPNAHAVTSRTTSAGTYEYQYDANGNLIKETFDDGITTEVTSHLYNYQNQIVQTTLPNSDIITYVYDHTGQRVKYETSNTTEIYVTGDYSLVDGTKRINVSLGGTSVATIDGTTTTYNHPDHLSSNTVVTDSTGAITQLIDYLPFGGQRFNETYGSTDTKEKYTGYEFDDETNLNYANARYYDSSLRRFNTIDPVPFAKPGQVLTDPQQLNLYGYSRNNPVMFNDQTGESATLILGGIGAFYGYYKQLATDIRANTANGATGIDRIAMNSSSESVAAYGESVLTYGGIGATAGALIDTGVAAFASTGFSKATLANMAKSLEVILAEEAGILVGGAGFSLARPSNFRKQTIRDAWDNAIDGITPDSKRCPTCNKEVTGNPHNNELRNHDNGWDVNHDPAWSTRNFDDFNSRSELLDNYNSGTELECRNCNRGRGNKPKDGKQ